MAFLFQLLHSALKPALHVIRPAAGRVRIQAGIFPSGAFLGFEFFGAVVPINDLFR